MSGTNSLDPPELAVVAPNSADLSAIYGYRSTSKAQTKEVSFLEFVEVSTTDSSLSLDLTNSNSCGLTTATTTINVLHSPLRPPLPGVHHFHYEPLRPPAAISHHPPAAHSSSMSSNNSNSSSSPSPLVTLPEPAIIPPYPEGYQLLLSPRPSITPISSSANQYSIFQTDDTHHLFPPTSASPQLLQYASNATQFYNCSPNSFQANNPQYDSLQPGLVPGCLQPPDGTLCNEAVISKSSSSDSDTNDSATRLISDSLADISNHHIYLMQQQTIVPDQNFAGAAAQYAGTSTGTQDTSNPPSSTETSDYKSDALWIQMQSEISKEMREKYLSVNGSSGSGTGSTGSNSSSKKKAKKNFTFRRIGCGKYGFVCPLRKSTVRYLTLALVSFLVLCSGLAMLFCYLRGWWIFEKNQTRPYGPDPDQYWWQGTTFYEIFPASFKDTDGDGFGDFNGITEQVAYLRSLGISAVRLSSIFAALDYPQRFEHVLDFGAVDPHLGSWQDFLKMIDTLHSNQIRVILELNPTITSDQHQWAIHWTLNGTGKYSSFYENITLSTERKTANKATDSVKFEEFATSIDAQADQTVTSSRSATYRHLEDTQFYFGGGLRLNWTHEPVRLELLKVATFWLHYVDGLYLTNLNQVYLEPNLGGAHSRGAILHDFMRKLRNSVGEMNQKSGKSEHNSRKILLCSSGFVDPFLSGIIKRRRSQERRSANHQFKPEFDDLDLDQSSLDPLDPMILANLHVMPYNQNHGPTTSHSQSSTFATPTNRVKQKTTKPRARKLYSYFDLIHFELNLSPAETDTIRDQVNYVFLNRPADFPTILWSLGSVHRPRIADRIGEERVQAGHFLLTMMPGTVSLLYGDEIGLADVYETHTRNKYRGGQLCPMTWSSFSPNGNFSRPNVTTAALWMPVHPEFARLNVEKRPDWVKAISDLNHFRLDHLYSDVQPGGRPLTTEINYLFHYIDDSIVVLEQHFDRRNPGSTQLISSLDDDLDSMTSDLRSNQTPPPSTRYRYVLFVNLGNETLVKDFSDKFHYSMTQLATNVNRTSEFLIMKSLKLDPGEAMIATVE